MGFVKSIFNSIADPRVFFTLAVAALALVIWKRERVASNLFAYCVFGFLALFFGLGSFDPNFRLIVTKPDNVPIVGLIFLLVFFVWYSIREGVINDRRIAAGHGPIEKAESDRVWVWPDLVYTELISLIVFSVILIVWSIFLKAPLEQPANPANTPNPSKAPWYFLGLQEMLVYFDPWIAGVVMPTMIIIGLMVIPYIDTNPLGSGYYTWKQRKFSISTFMFGFVILWVAMIIIGTFIRGPGWQWFWPGQTWDHNRLIYEVNRDLPDLFGITSNMAKAVFGAIVVGGFYLVGGGAVYSLFRRKMQKDFQRMSLLQFSLMAFLWLTMLALPLKMALRLLWHIKYVWITPWFNV